MSGIGPVFNQCIRCKSTWEGEGRCSHCYPTEIPLKTKEGGVKWDGGKSPVVRGALQYFPRALSSVAEVSQKGAEKYTWKGWETVPDGFVRYSDALGRHLLSESISDTDEETGCLHAAQVAWNALARLELLLRELEADNASDNA